MVFFLPYIPIRACSLIQVQLFGTPWTVTHQAPLSMEWVAISYPRGSSQLRDQNSNRLHLLHWQADSLPLCYLVILNTSL